MKNKTQQAKRGNVSDHTPTPWIYDQKEGCILTGKPLGLIASFSILAHADAEFIVRAVNSHEALLEAAKSVCDEYYKQRGDMTESMNDLNKAIAQAEGGK